MLVLTRTIGTTVHIGSDIVLTVLEVRSGQVKLGIEAPREIPVHRGEVAAAIKAGIPTGERKAAEGGRS